MHIPYKYKAFYIYIKQCDCACVYAALCDKQNSPVVVVVDVCVQVSPPYDVGSMTSLTAANLLFEMLCVVQLSKTVKNK